MNTYTGAHQGPLLLQSPEVIDVHDTFGTQGLACYGGDFHHLLAIRHLWTSAMSPAPRDGRLNGDHVDLHSASRVTVEWLTAIGGYRGMKVGGVSAQDPRIASYANQLRHARFEDFTDIAVGGDCKGATLDDVTAVRTAGIEARNGMQLARCRTFDTHAGRVGLLATGEGAIFALGCDFDTVAVDAHTILYVDASTKIGEVIRCDGLIMKV